MTSHRELAAIYDRLKPKRILQRRCVFPYSVRREPIPRCDAGSSLNKLQGLAAATTPS